MSRYNLFPDQPLTPNGEISQVFIALNLDTFQKAVQYVHQLPYRRNSERANYRLVLPEKCGVCSTKNALIAKLAQEQNIDMQLMLAILNMTPTNMPKLADILTKHQLPYLPEAHNYLLYQNQRPDLTFPDQLRRLSPRAVLLEHAIDPDDIGEYKIQFHEKYLKKWLKEENLPYTLEEMLKIREACIEALSH